MDISAKIEKLRGPIVVLGASGFIGANLMKRLLAVRSDVYGVISKAPAWRLADLPEKQVLKVDLNVSSNLDNLLEKYKFQTVFDCAAYGAYSFETDLELIYETNFLRVVRLTEKLLSRNCTYIYAGSSSEYGDFASGPQESNRTTPNSHYAVSKSAVSNLLFYLGKTRKFPCAHLRLYSVYGPLEDSSRLIPNLVKMAQVKKYPDFVSADISRDFIYVDDAVDAFISTSYALNEELYGETYNVGSGTKTTIGNLAELSKQVFGISEEPRFSAMQNRRWDVKDWFADISKITKDIGWAPKIGLREGLLKTEEWLKSLGDLKKYELSSKKYELDTRSSVSAIIACYKDGQAIPIMYERLTQVFQKLRIDYEIIFVNDGSPDDSENVILELTKKDKRVIGISHSRNFGSQSAFRSGMEISTKNSCVLLDGDLQDPPELIENFVEKWRQGFDVVFGRRVKREAPLHMQIAYKLFYYLFDKFSYLKIPRDAGDFSLMDKSVVQWILKFPERDLFLRGVRAYVGFRQTGVDYFRPERMFGKTTNNFFKNVGWLKKGILSFSNVPLNMLSFGGFVLFVISLGLMALQIIAKALYPEIAPTGLTTVILTVIFFGSLNLFGLSLLGEYLAKIFEEVKQRPHFIRRAIIRDGKLRLSSEALSSATDRQARG